LLQFNWRANKYKYILKAGFTLLEVLIALAITSFIVTALYGTFFLSQKAIDSIDDSLIRLQEARTVVDNLKRELESAYHLSGSEYPVFRLEDRDFYGRSASRITFTTFSPLTAGLAKISYNLEENDGKLMLKKSISSAFPSKTKTKDMELAEDIHSFSIEVKFKDKWVKTWDSKTTNGIPEDVRIAITFFTENKDAKKEGEETVSVFDVAKPMIGKTNVL
jgi:general secretion pathway protein J